MQDWEACLIAPEDTIETALHAIEHSWFKIALVCDAHRRLLGTVTDGDIRRGLLRGTTLRDPATEVLNRNPHVATASDSTQAIIAMMRDRLIRQLPMLDADGRVIGILVDPSLTRPRQHANWVVIMAGGLGSRLRPLTDATPKPLLPVGERPIIETMLRRFVDSGFSKFFVTVRYKAEMLEAYLGDGRSLRANISYIRETEPLGTAGALALLPRAPTEPVIVINGDVLTTLDFGALMEFHRQQGADATMCVREYQYQVPYGVVETDNARISRIVEKPVHRHMINAGIYVIGPRALEHIPPGEPLDMPTLFARLREKGLTTSAFVTREYWIDIGQMTDYERAEREFESTFQTPTAALPA